MGRGPADVQSELKLFPFRIDSIEQETSSVSCSVIEFSPRRRLSAFILRELKNWAEAHFGETV